MTTPRRRPRHLVPVYLRTRREHLRLTQQDLEKTSGVAQNTISKLESNPHARPLSQTVFALAASLGVDPARLRFGPDPEHPPIGRRASQKGVPA
jgi:transcriptional regulator with XRE-family HTH domain